MPEKKTKNIIVEKSVIPNPKEKLKKGMLKFRYLVELKKYKIEYYDAGPWNDFSKFELSMMHINNKNDLSYVNHMKGWYLEVYKEEKYLSTSVIVVFPNDGKECDHGKHKT